MKKVFIGLLLFALLAVITNPNEAKHKEAAKREFDQTLEKDIGLNTEFISANFFLNGKPFVTFIERENQYLFSTTILRIEEEKKVLGYGFFGFVIINRNALQE